MIFIPLLILGIGLYFSGKRVWSGLIFLFFMSYGFQFIPDSLFDTGLGISKSTDFALIYLFSICLVGLGRYKDFLVFNKLTIAIFIFLLFILVSMMYSRYHLHVTWNDILRTSRPFFFVLSYFVFRRLTKAELLELLRIAFIITLVGCTLYVLQGITGVPFLVGGGFGKFGTLNRYYNFPMLYYVFIGYCLFSNPLQGRWKYFSIAIFILVAILSQHRGMMIAIFVSAFWAIYILEGGIKGIFKYLLIGGLISLPVLGLLVDRFGGKTSQDIAGVMEGEFIEHSGDVELGGTFTFRMGLLYERGLYVFEKPERIVFGVGFMTEGSERAKKEFDFLIGLSDEMEDKVQLDTSDMAWIAFVLRLGVVGTLIYMFLYYLLAKSLYIYRKDRLVISFLFYIVLLFINSFSSTELYNGWMIVPVLMIYALKENEQAEEGGDKYIEDNQLA